MFVLLLAGIIAGSLMAPYTPAKTPRPDNQ
jgi:hypothetical protein